MITIKENVDRKLSSYVGFFFLMSAINSLIKTVFPIDQSLWGTISLIIGGFILVVFISIIPLILKRRWRLLFSSLLIIFIIGVISYVIDPKASYILKDTMIWLLLSWSVFITVYSIYNISVLYNTLLRYSWWISACLIIMIIFFSTREDIRPLDYSMSFSYSLALPMLLHYIEYTRTRKSLYILAFIFEFLLALLFGSRGVIFCVISAVILSFLISKSINFYHKFFTVVSLSLIGILAYIYLPALTNSLFTFFAEQGHQSRTLLMLSNLSKEGVYLSGRDLIWESTIDLIKERPIFGWGISAGIRKLSTGLYITDTFVYPHNIFLELNLNYGIVIGTLFSLIMVLSPLHLIKSSINTSTKQLFILFYSVGLISLLFSGQYLTSPNFFAFLALLMKIQKYKKRSPETIHITNNV